MAGLQSTLAPARWREWKQAYDYDLRQRLLALAKAGQQRPFVLVVLWGDDELGPYLDVVIDASVSALGEAIQVVVVCPQVSASVSRLEQLYGARVVTMPLHHLCHGFGSLVVAAEGDAA